MLNNTVSYKTDGYIAMPYLYRTPELVAYANKQDVLHIESDIFQLGLVLAELFTGSNPLFPSNNIKEKIQLNPLRKINNTKDGGLIFKLLNSRLELNYKNRPDFNYFLSNFTMLYEKSYINNSISQIK